MLFDENVALNEYERNPKFRIQSLLAADKNICASCHQDSKPGLLVTCFACGKTICHRTCRCACDNPGVAEQTILRWFNVVSMR